MKEPFADEPEEAEVLEVYGRLLLGMYDAVERVAFGAARARGYDAERGREMLLDLDLLAQRVRGWVALEDGEDTGEDGAEGEEDAGGDDRAAGA